MNVQRLTKKSLEAVETAQNYSRELENMQIEQIHLFWALVQDQEGLIPQLLIKMNTHILTKPPCDVVFCSFVLRHGK